MKALIFCAMAVPAVAMAGDADVAFLTEDYAPYSWMENGEAVGHGIDLIHEVANRAALTSSVEITKWTRAIVLAEKNENTCVFSTARTEEREPKFQWAGPMYVESTYLVQRAGENTDVTTLDVALTKAIGTQVGDFTVELLQGLGAAKVDTAPDLEKTLKKLRAGRLDYVILGEDGAKSITAQNADLEMALEVSRDEFFIACSKSTPAETVAKIDAAMASMMEDGTQAQMVAKYK
ncbi:transporter substrate-binding domain-containing protein [Shimia sp. R9_1]|uniref:substrate-binding periplasmic protein n=1 Tax=Shimia sp. R9_1 TaxID=2821111 RepID=UPI001ADA2597|nr:transporter substrate-binding domain-containing protein [Shimia sp. R9_1]MBO9408751.1 transporter substrate-binding domain-containing protein [Shimia sp. R9_1]